MINLVPSASHRCRIDVASIFHRVRNRFIQRGQPCGRVAPQLGHSVWSAAFMPSGASSRGATRPRPSRFAGRAEGPTSGTSSRGATRPQKSAADRRDVFLSSIFAFALMKYSQLVVLRRLTVVDVSLTKTLLGAKSSVCRTVKNSGFGHYCPSGVLRRGGVLHPVRHAPVPISKKELQDDRQQRCAAGN